MHFKSIVAVIWNCHLFKIHIINNLNNITHCIFWSILSLHDDEGDKVHLILWKHNQSKILSWSGHKLHKEIFKRIHEDNCFQFFHDLSVPFFKSWWNYSCINQSPLILYFVLILLLFVEQTTLILFKVFLSNPSPIIVYPCHSLGRDLDAEVWS